MAWEEKEPVAPGVGDLRKGTATCQSGKRRRSSARNGGPRCIKEMFVSIGKRNGTSTNHYKVHIDKLRDGST